MNIASEASGRLQERRGQGWQDARHGVSGISQRIHSHARRRWKAQIRTITTILSGLKSQRRKFARLLEHIPGNLDIDSQSRMMSTFAAHSKAAYEQL